MDIDPKPLRPNGHDSHPAIGIADALCPVCDSPISREKFAEIEGVRRGREAEIIHAVESRFARQIADAERKKKGEIAAAAKAATLVAETKLKALRESQEATITARVAAEQEKAGKAIADAVAAAKIEHATEKARLETALADVQRKLAAKTAFAIGEKPEADLFESMTQLCPTDRVTRTARGVKGGDVLIEVLHGDGNEVAGKILLDSKAHAKWQSSFGRKLAADKMAIEADFALLVSTILPAGEQQICIRDGIICCAPERVPVLVNLLRKIVLDNFVLKLSTQQRDTKADRLFNFIVSGVGGDLFDRLIRLTRDLEALGLAEERSHKLTWSRRAELVRGVVEVHETFTTTIAEVVGGGR